MKTHAFNSRRRREFPALSPRGIARVAGFSVAMAIGIFSAPLTSAQEAVAPVDELAVKEQINRSRAEAERQRALAEARELREAKQRAGMVSGGTAPRGYTREQIAAWRDLQSNIKVSEKPDTPASAPIQNATTPPPPPPAPDPNRIPPPPMPAAAPGPLPPSGDDFLGPGESITSAAAPILPPAPAATESAPIAPIDAPVAESAPAIETSPAVVAVEEPKKKGFLGNLIGRIVPGGGDSEGREREKGGGGGLFGRKKDRQSPAPAPAIGSAEVIPPPDIPAEMLIRDTPPPPGVAPDTSQSAAIPPMSPSPPAPAVATTGGPVEAGSASFVIVNAEGGALFRVQGGTETANLPAGTVMRAAARHGASLEVELANGRRGFVEARMVREARFDEAVGFYAEGGGQP
ncbi:MAG: hypothetical protein KDM91_07865 [Verrucomicrobiae bacterium]|nr:hypothetical protein [Verrucomicrobiae bacterium]MCP5541639.1 hypothetical protein [Akkermansiaceae bacterium]